MRVVAGLLLIGFMLGGCGGGGSDSSTSTAQATDPTTPTTPTASAPVVSALSPASATAGGAAFTLTVNGSNFISSSVVQWNGAALQTMFVKASQLTASVPASDIAASGSATVTVANGAADGGTSAAAAFTIGAASNPGSSSGPSVVQMNTYQTQNTGTEQNSTLAFTNPTKAGDTIWVAVTVSDYAGAHSISVSDSQGNTYVPLLPQENDGSPGFQTVAQFYAANIKGDTATSDTVYITWGTDDYKGILITEISGTHAAPLVGSAANIQDGNLASLDSVTSGGITVSAAQVPALMLALSMNTNGGTSDLGGSGKGAPTAGAGMTQVAQLWDFGASPNLATFATLNITGPETATSSFVAPDTTDSFVTVSAVFY